MKRRYGALIGLCLLLVIATAAGCTRENAEQSAEANFAQVRDQFLAQQTYDFHGRTQLITGNTSNGNLVTFTGKKQPDHTYLDVALSVPEKNQPDTMSLLSKNQQLYAKFGKEDSWQPVQGDRSLQQEFANWDPAYSFEQMDTMRTKVIPLDDGNQSDGRKAFRVLLDSNKLKTWLAEQMTAQSRSKVQSIATPKLKLAMTLSESEWKRRPAGAQIQAADTKSKINDIIDHMEVEAEYTVYYDEKQMLPTSIIMNIRSEYDMQNQRVDEHSEIETYLLNYGRADMHRQP